MGMKVLAELVDFNKKFGNVIFYAIVLTICDYVIEEHNHEVDVITIFCTITNAIIAIKLTIGALQIDF